MRAAAAIVQLPTTRAQARIAACRSMTWKLEFDRRVRLETDRERPTPRTRIVFDHPIAGGSKHVEVVWYKRLDTRME
ncbi:hypothetical protein WT56_07640 [Burkholderia pseudomultivorans]|uniref:Uncharacterized protein n=2 Tax=Burkholderia pseudomultivorans TaxID=1207504 RepID=A0A132ELP9_9BURK|nr:hypothetical protein WT56_07640 [Burkholderia pseudomultivorans]